jgi:putative copper export protein
MFAPVLTATLVRWLTLVATAVVIGGLVLELWTLPGVADVAAARGRLRRMVLVGIAALILATTGELVTRAQTMSGGSVTAAIAAVPAVLSRTHFGTVWIARAAALAVILAASLARGRRVRVLVLLLAVGAALTTSLTGHAADWGDLSFSVLVDWIHIVAAAVWTGGLMGLALVVPITGSTWPAERLGTVVRRFSRLAGLCLLGVVLSGAYNAWLQLRGVAALGTTAYGRVLVLKLVFVVAVVGLGAVNRYTVVARLAPGRPRGPGARLFHRARLGLFGRAPASRRPLPLRLSTYVAREAWLAVLIFGCTAILGELTPGRHARGLPHGEPGDHGSRHTTMGARHESGGARRGWMFTPPEGEARRGREVFARLHCFACHRVEGEEFPGPSRPGPDLTDVGAHHSASSLTESIMNANAVIVAPRSSATAVALRPRPRRRFRSSQRRSVPGARGPVREARVVEASRSSERLAILDEHHVAVGIDEPRDDRRPPAVHDHVGGGGAHAAGRPHRRDAALADEERLRLPRGGLQDAGGEGAEVDEGDGADQYSPRHRSTIAFAACQSYDRNMRVFTTGCAAE